MGSSSPDILPHTAIFFANVLIGIGNVVSKIGLHGMNPLLFALLREVITCPFMLLFSCCLEQRCGRRTTSPPERRRVVVGRFLLSGFAMYGSNAFYIVGVKFAGASVGALWASAQPVMITLASVLCGLEACTWLKGAGVATASAGCAMVSVLSSQHQDQGIPEYSHLGNGCFMVQCVCVATFYVSQKSILRHFPPMMTLGYLLGTAAVFMTATTAVFTLDRRLFDFMCVDCQGGGWTVPADSWLAVMYWVVFCSGLAYFLNTWGNARVPASIIGIYCTVQPVVTLLVSSLVILFTPPPHYQLNGFTWADIGEVGIFAGVALVVLDSIRQAGKTSPVTCHLAPEGPQDSRGGLIDPRNCECLPGNCECLPSRVAEG